MPHHRQYHVLPTDFDGPGGCWAGARTKAGNGRAGGCRTTGGACAGAPVRSNLLPAGTTMSSGSSVSSGRSSAGTSDGPVSGLTGPGSEIGGGSLWSAIGSGRAAGAAGSGLRVGVASAGRAGAPAWAPDPGSTSGRVGADTGITSGGVCGAGFRIGIASGVGAGFLTGMGAAAGRASGTVGAGLDGVGSGDTRGAGVGAEDSSALVSAACVRV